MEEKNIPLWVRHVVVKGYTDDTEQLISLGRFIGGLKNLRALDVLPYHNLGEVKYRELGIPYPLKGLAPTTKAEADAARAKILEGVNEVRRR